MTEHDLVKAGFIPHGDGSMHLASRITLEPAGEFYRLTIELANGDVLTCHVAKLALKEEKQC